MSPESAEANIVVAATSAGAWLQLGIGLTVFVHRAWVGGVIGATAAEDVTGVVKSDQVPHLVRERVLQILHLPGVSESW